MKEGEALIRSRAMANAPGAGLRVSFQPEFVLNSLDTWETIDIRPKTCIYDIEAQLADGSQCSLEAEFVVAVPAHEDKVLCAAGALGVKRASSQDEIQELYRFSLVDNVQLVLARCTPEKSSKETDLIRRTLLEMAPFSLEECGFELQSVDIRKMRFHKKAEKKWTL